MLHEKYRTNNIFTTRDLPFLKDAEIGLKTVGFRVVFLIRVKAAGRHIKDYPIGCKVYALILILPDAASFFTGMCFLINNVVAYIIYKTKLPVKLDLPHREFFC